MQIDQNKFNRQVKGVERWRIAKNLGISYANGIGILWWVTGMGKTFTACWIIKNLMEKNNAGTVWIVVPSERLEKQWNEEIRKFLPIYLHNINIISVNKLIELTYLISCTLLIIDEIHEFYTDERFKIVNGQMIKSPYRLGLTATFKDIHKRHKKVEEIMPIVDRITEEEALREGWISRYIEYNVGIDLTPQESKNYINYSNTINRHLNKFGKKGFDLAKLCLSGKDNHKGIDYCFALAVHNGWKKDMDLSIQKNKDINDLWHPGKIMGYAKELMECIRERMAILYNAQNKLLATKEIVDKFPTLKTITFSQSTQFADKIGAILNDNKENPICVVYHSKLKTKIIYDEIKGKEIKKGQTVLKREAIDAIKTGKRRVISTSSSLDRGFDVEDISLAITTSGTQNPTQYNQRKGRALRVNYFNQNEIVLVINIYVRNTKDQEWLIKRQSETKNIIYFVDKVNDINYTPKSNDVYNIDEL